MWFWCCVEVVLAAGEAVFGVGGGRGRGSACDGCWDDWCVLGRYWTKVECGVFEGGLWWAVVVDAGVGGCCGDLVVCGFDVDWR